MIRKNKILLTGATGYVGGKLLKRLEAEGHEVNCLTRSPERLLQTAPKTTVYQGDILMRSSLWKAFSQVHTAYFIIDFINEKEGFEDKEIQAALNFACMAREAGVSKIIYLGALADEKEELSPHLRSRLDVGYGLRKSNVPSLELQSSIVIGQGSSSFDAITDLTDRLPFMITPKWVSRQTQPIGIKDLIEYLFQALDLPIKNHQILQIGGKDRMSYGDLIKTYAQLKGLNRVMIPVPVLTPKLSSRWVSHFSRLDQLMSSRLIEGIRNTTVVRDRRAALLFNVKPLSAVEAIKDALQEQSSKEIHNVYAA